MLIIIDALSNQHDIVKYNCPLHKKSDFIISKKAVNYAAFINYWLVIKKIDDNILDSKFFHKTIFKGISKFLSFNKYYKKCFLNYSSCVKKLEISLNKYYQAEKNKVPFDNLSNYYSNFMLLLFQVYLNINSDKYNKVSDVVNQVIINIGKLIYLADAFDDYIKDLSHGNFNALLGTTFSQSSDEEIIEQVFIIIKSLQKQSCELINSIEIKNKDIIINHIKWFDINLVNNIIKQKGKYSWNSKTSFQTFIKQ